MGFFSFIVLLAIAYLIWRVTDQLPDLIFRLSEIQRDVAEIRRRLAESADAPAGGQGPQSRSAPAPSAPATPAAGTTPSAPPTSGGGSDTSGS